MLEERRVRPTQRRIRLLHSRRDADLRVPERIDVVLVRSPPHIGPSTSMAPGNIANDPSSALAWADSSNSRRVVEADGLPRGGFGASGGFGSPK